MSTKRSLLRLPAPKSLSTTISTLGIRSDGEVVLTVLSAPVYHSLGGSAVDVLLSGTRRLLQVVLGYRWR